MSDYRRIVTTNQGKNMVTESIRTKSAIIFTKISLGDGLLNGETIETMTGLKHRLMDGNVPKINHLGNGEIEAVSTVSNSELTAGFFARELGLFAKLGEEGEEQLFAYTNAGSNASYIPPNTSVDEKMLGIQLGVGDAIVQVNYQSHLYITYEQLEDGIAHHNSDENAHGGLLQNLKSQLATHNTDISSHPAITAMIAKILGSSDWQEEPVATLKDIKNKLGEGGIVAQRFGESGFVKYANGFTIQWGIVKRGRLDMWYTAPTKFPIAFTEVYVGVGTIQESATERSSSNFDNAVRLSLDKIEFAKFEHYYIALGRS
nr:MAG TPA: tail-collar fiber protein [Bacteriophage sp.]